MFLLEWMDTYCGYKFVFSAHNTSAKTATNGLVQCLIYGHGMPHSIASDQGTNFTQQIKCVKFTGFITFSTILKQLALENSGMASEDSVTLYLASLEQGSSGGCLCSVSASPTAGAVSPTARIHRSRNQRVKMQMTSFTITPSDSLEKFFLPVPKNLYSAGLVLSSK